ncbi:MAG: efflux RND transporter periplasmic adaptor subunit [Bacteroidales bacterium]|jgi:membrane fusion protein (multidrug efflux system)|nr:efflux RND transporter periplasmic adaptor subunit [Bacteroidales bacterium]
MVLLLLWGCNSAPSETQQAAEYSIIKIASADQTISSSYPATIRGRQDIEIYPQVSGIVTRLYVNEGQQVRNGQTLFVIDQVPYQTALSQAAANVKAAEAAFASVKLAYESNHKLFEENVISDFELQTSRNAMLSAEAALLQAKASEANALNSLSYTIVKSPADGVVGVLPYRQGALVAPNIAQPLTTVSDNSEMYVYFSITENQLLNLVRSSGSKEEALKSMPAIELQLNDKTMYDETGTVEAISGVIDLKTGTVSVRGVFPNRKGLLHSGSSGNVILPVQRGSCIVIPQTATYEMQDKVFVYKIVDAKAKSVQITVERVNGGKEYIVNSGLNVGDEIVSEGVGLLREDTPVIAKPVN